MTKDVYDLSNKQEDPDWQALFKRASLGLNEDDQISTHSEQDKANRQSAGIIQATPNIEAAVLVPLVVRGQSPHIVLTRRTQHLPSHKGQVAFPGGKIDPTDENAAAAAIRETHEEIGHQPEQIQLVGKLPQYETGTGFIITPITANLLPPIAFRREQGEVDEIFEVPLSHVSNLQNYRQHEIIHEGVKRIFWQLEYKDYYIWGATAAILIDLASRISKAQN